MGFYHGDEIYGISWSKYDEQLKKYQIEYTYDSIGVLTAIEIDIIKKKFELIDDYSKYFFQAYKSSITTHDTKPEPFFMWMTVEPNFLIDYFTKY